jgi:hypothetical protein
MQEGLRGPVEINATNRTTGERGIVILSAAAIKLDSKPCILTVALNVTALRRAEQQFRQTQKMEAIGRIAGGIAHDFNNLLTVVGGYTQLALEKLPPGDPLRPSLLEVSKAAGQAEWLTRQLLTLSRDKTPEPSVIDLNPLIRDTEMMLRRLIGENIELRVSLKEGSATVRMDPGQMVQVLVNLAVNSRDAMPEGGSLSIRTETVEVAEEFSRAWKLKASAHVRLTVSDTGTGMDEETQSHIFEPFFTTKPEGQGTGLGLSMVYGIVKQGEGSIMVSSEPGAGTVMEILLPMADPADLTHRSRIASEVKGGKETVLLAEDDEALRKFAREVLERAGYLVLQAADGDEALRLSDSLTGPIDLLVTDLTMPGTGGLEVARRLRLERPGLAVLYMSGQPSGGAREEAREDHRGEFLQKPFSPGELLNGARRALDVTRLKQQ